jgi:predicted esterase
MGSGDFHQGQPLLMAGTPLERAASAMVMLHGRGAGAADILSVADELGRPDLAYVAPQAAGRTWYPNRFSAPIVSNEPWFTSALEVVAHVLSRVAAAGIPVERTLLLGFSQGACLALEFAARRPNLYGGVIGLSGALIENGDEPRVYQGSLNSVPVFLGCSTTDPHVPRDRVERSAELFRGLGAAVTLRLYPNMDHTVNADELESVKAMITRVDTAR